MSPSPCNRNPDPAPTTGVARSHQAAGRIVVAALLLTLAGCAHFASPRVAACDGRCRETKERCDDNARYQFHQCEAGYQGAQRDYRRCNSDGWQQCGYPWWSCSENLYGYCTNRFRECQSACRALAD